MDKLEVAVKEEKFKQAVGEIHDGDLSKVSVAYSSHQPYPIIKVVEKVSAGKLTCEIPFHDVVDHLVSTGVIDVDLNQWKPQTVRGGIHFRQFHFRRRAMSRSTCRWVSRTFMVVSFLIVFLIVWSVL